MRYPPCCVLRGPQTFATFALSFPKTRELGQLYFIVTSGRHTPCNPPDAMPQPGDIAPKVVYERYPKAEWAYE